MGQRAFKEPSISSALISFAGRGLVVCLVMMLTLWAAPPVQAQGPVPRIDKIDAPSALQYAGQPFDIEIRASNVGSDAEGGGSITLVARRGRFIYLGRRCANPAKRLVGLLLSPISCMGDQT